MGKDPKKAELDEHARRFLECAAAGARGKDLSDPLELLKTVMDGMIGRVHARRSPTVPYAVADLRQDVYERLLRKPPTNTQGPHGPAATVCAWVKNTAQRIMIDKSRRAQGLVFVGFDDSHNYAGAGNNVIDAYVHVERQSRVDLLSRMLEKESSTMHNFFRTMVQNQSLSTKEIAKILKTSEANVHTLFHRLRERIIEFDEKMEQGGK
jgi:DNA-directed RNA polymerase specialized sigma24 family protein